MKRMFGFIAGIAVSMLLTVSAFAGTWRSDSNGWWYQNDDGSFPAGTWQWIDGNGDYTAECYYFYHDGYMAYNNTIEGSQVNNDGQWTVHGEVQKRSVQSGSSGGSQTSDAGARDMSYAKYLRGTNVLWNNSAYGETMNFYLVDAVVSPSTLIEREDCYEVTGVTVEYPYEFSIKRDAEAKIQELKRAGIDTSSAGTCQNATGTYSIFFENEGDKYSYPVWNGSIYIRKDAVLRTFSGDMTFTDGYRRDYSGRFSCWIVAVDDEGYVTVLRKGEFA